MRVTVATPRTVIVPQVVRMAQNGAAAALAALKLQMTVIGQVADLLPAGPSA